ncbi:MAG: class I SAM-dependent methyltransferase [Kofleriaceae bacterium]
MIPQLATVIERAIDSGRVPEAVLRAGIRAVCAQRLRELRGTVEEEAAAHQAFVDELRAAPIAIATEAANRQHYEVPAAFFDLVLGPHRKYSACLWTPEVTDLAGAEAAMLERTAARAGLADGQAILDLGCGWGSMSLWAARRYPRARITAVSNSASQRAAIEARAAAAGLDNLRVVTADVRTLDLAALGTFDRVVSIEMFEHMRNYRALLARIAAALAPGGALFVHVFAHTRHAYPFDDAGATDWMAREFFTGGLMPSTQLLHHFQDDLRLEAEWHLGGEHYARTAEAWYANLMARQPEVLRALGDGDDPAAAARRLQRWRVFFLACAELFGYRHGREWVVAHYRFARR